MSTSDITTAFVQAVDKSHKTLAGAVSSLTDYQPFVVHVTFHLTDQTLRLTRVSGGEGEKQILTKTAQARVRVHELCNRPNAFVPQKYRGSVPDSHLATTMKSGLYVGAACEVSEYLPLIVEFYALSTLEFFRRTLREQGCYRDVFAS